MAKRAFRGRRFSAKGPKTLWVTDVQSSLVGPTNEITSFVICAGSDWERQGGTSELATILAVKGYLYMHTEDTTIADGSVRLSAMLAVADEDSVALTALGSTIIDKEQSMWAFHGGMAYSGVNEAVNTGVFQNSLEIDVKTKRKLTNGQGLDLTINYEVQAGTGNISRVGWVLRTLVKVG